MKFLILCAVVVAAQAALPLGLYHHLGGASTQYRGQDLAGNYHFGYNEGHATGGTFRRETGDAAGNKVGAYGLTDVDGRHRVVNYVADGAGFRADIKTNEPGVDASKDPAAIAINKAGIIAPHHLGYYGHHLGYYGHHLGALTHHYAY